jgi:tripartite-type tricarboxylate transporter receptor subunit TctC
MRTSSSIGRTGLFCGAVLSFIVVTYVPGWSLDYPTKSINLVVASTPGGPSDLHARILAEAGSKELGVPMVIVNKPGIGGGQAATYVIKEKPDGYTFLVTQSGTTTSNFALFQDLVYKRTDLVPLFRAIIIPCFVAVRADAPWKSFQDLLDAAKKTPGKIKSSSASANITLLWEGLVKQAGVDFTHLPYKGSSENMLALLGGHTDVYLDNITAILPHVEAGKIRLLIAISSKRFKTYPDIPTFSEFGYSNFSRDMWNGWYAPKGLSKPIMERFVSAFRKVLSQPSVDAQLERVGLFGGFLPPEEFAALIEEEYQLYMDVAKQRTKK